MQNEQVVVGIDLGSSRFVVSIVNASGVDVLVNQSSYRQTPTAVVFGDQRTTGDKALPVARRDLDNSIFGPSRFLGELTHQSLQHEMNFNFCTTFFQSPGQVGFEVRLGAQKGSIRAEQLVAGLFSEAMGILQFNGVQPKEVVVSVPDSFGQTDRTSLLAAAQISGLPITKLLNESSANALNYSVFRRNEFDAATPRVVGFVDVGHAKTTVSFAAITAFQVEILASHSNPSLGCRDLDLLLLQHYGQILRQRFQVDIFQQKKLRFKLMEAIAKQRTTLTINADAQLTLECVDGDQDFTTLLKREELEKIGANFFKAIKATFDAALAALPRKHAKALHSVERVGGGCRIPAVERLIGSCFKVAHVSKTLDASESIARGCALQAAMLSPKYMFSNYKLVERLQYPVTVKLQFGTEEPKGQTLFEAGSDLCRRVNLDVKRLEQLTLAICLPSKTQFEEKISSYTTIPARVQGQELTIYFVLDHNGIVNFENAVVKAAGGTPAKGGLSQPLSLNISRPGELSVQEVEAFQKLEVVLLRQEIMIQEKAASRNRLEALIYATKGALSQDGLGKWSEEGRQELSRRIEQLENWLYGPGATADKETFDAETESLQDQLAALSGRGDVLSASRSLSQKLQTRLREAEQWLSRESSKSETPSLQRVRELLEAGTRLLAEVGGLRDRFSLAALGAFGFEGWFQRATSVIEALEQVGLPSQ